MKKIAIWLTYDLGVGGDFQKLYSWLDDHEAIECGNNVAYIKYRYPDKITTDSEFVTHLKKELEKRIEIKPTNRIYIIRKSLDKGSTSGIFVFGKRKASPWEGFGSNTENTIDE